MTFRFMPLAPTLHGVRARRIARHGVTIAGLGSWALLHLTSFGEMSQRLSM